MQMATGLDDRRNSWIFTSDRFAEHGVYIVLPVNPSSFEVANPIRGTTGETQRGKFMYVHRNPLSKSVIAPCNYTFEIPSGMILPQFSPEYIKQARDLAHEFSTTMHSLRNAQSVNSFTENALGMSDADKAEQRARIYNNKVSSYRASVANNFESKFPSLDQTLDYRTLSPHYESRLGFDNIPSLYVPDVPIGIQNFYAFIMLLDEPKVFTDKNGVVRNNRIIIHFNALELPAMTFYGWPDAGGLSFTEDVESYGEFNITFSVFVTGASPALGYNHFDALMTNYKAEIAGTSTSLDRLRAVLGNASTRAL